jgi:predicted amino acid racemase
MGTPYLSIDLDKIEQNAREIVRLCTTHGIEVAGVTKGVCGHPAIAQAMLRGGVAAVADSRLINVRRLRDGGIRGEIMLLRIPALSAVENVINEATVSLNTELSVLAALSNAARQAHPHGVVVMVELGDLREGVPSESLVPFMQEAARLPGIRLQGLGTNLACYSGLKPSEVNMRRFVALAEEVESACDLPLERLSAVNSSGLELIAAGRMPQRINHARIGEAILLGRETTQRRPWPGTHQDAFVLHAEVLECRRKPSRFHGDYGQDAFGASRSQQPSGEGLRALVNVGREDVDENQLTPREPGVEILGASSGYLVLDVNVADGIRVGDELTFAPGYGALLRAMTSEYVEKRCQ